MLITPQHRRRIRRLRTGPRISRRTDAATKDETELDEPDQEEQPPHPLGQAERPGARVGLREGRRSSGSAASTGGGSIGATIPTTRWRPTSSATSTARSSRSRGSSTTPISTCGERTAGLSRRRTERATSWRSSAPARCRRVDGFSVSSSRSTPTIQRMAEDELAKVAEQYDPQKATIIVSDPQTGFILALANYPSFDLNTLQQARQGRPAAGCATSRSPTSTSPGRCSRSSRCSGALNDGLVTTQTPVRLHAGEDRLQRADPQPAQRGRQRPLRPSAQRRGDHRPLLEQGRGPARDERSATGGSTTTRGRSASASARDFPVGGEVTGQPQGAGKMGQHDHHPDADGPVRDGDGAADAAGDGGHRHRADCS